MNRGQQLVAIPTWQTKHPKDELDKLALDEGLWNHGYAMNPIAPGELKFPHWELKVRKSGILLSQLWERRLPAYIGVDLSSKSRPGNAIVAIGLEPPTMRRYVLEVRYGAWSSPDTASALADVCSHHNVQWIMVENNAYQQSIIDWVKKEKGQFQYWMKVQPFTTGAGKADPQYGLPGLEVEFKNDSWVVPYSEYEGHPTTCECDWCHLDSEVRYYPRAATSDGVMAMWFAWSAANKWAPVARGPRVRGNIRRR